MLVSDALSWAWALLQSPPSVKRPLLSQSIARHERAAAPPLRFLPLQRLPTQDSGFRSRVCLARLPAPPGFLNPLAPSSVPRLLALFHARSALGVRPPEPSSSRAAACRLRHRYPLDVGIRAANLPASSNAACEAETPQRYSNKHMGRPRERPRLQGLAPHESPPLSASGLGLASARSSPGLSSSRALPLDGMARLSPRLPS
jgi:hypothetical protein